MGSLWDVKLESKENINRTAQSSAKQGHSLLLLSRSKWVKDRKCLILCWHRCSECYIKKKRKQTHKLALDLFFLQRL